MEDNTAQVHALAEQVEQVQEQQVQSQVEQVHEQAQEQQVQSQVEQVQEQVPVSFDNINPLSFQYSGQHKCALSTAGQIINALSNLSLQISDGTKQATNDYQRTLYPSIGTVASGVVGRYTQTFVDGTTDPLTKQVYGANLNGSRNDGRLNRPVTIRGVNKFLIYDYAQLGQLLNLLRHRLTFVSSRNALSIKRYADNEQERVHFVALQGLTQDFCKYLSDEVYPQWEQFVNNARIQNSIKLSSDNVEEVAEKTTKSTEKRTYDKKQRSRQSRQPRQSPTQSQDVRQERSEQRSDTRPPQRRFEQRERGDRTERPQRRFEQRERGDRTESPQRRFEQRERDDQTERPQRRFEQRERDDQTERPQRRFEQRERDDQTERPQRRFEQRERPFQGRGGGRGYGQYGGRGGRHSYSNSRY
jgi:hypothetical protein